MEKERLGPLTRNVAANLRVLRKQRGMSLAEVSEQLEQLGAPLSLNAVSKIELGNRGVDLDEVTALARALRVPPLLLIFPIGRERWTEVLPGAIVGTWRGAQWFTGEAVYPRYRPPSTQAFWDGTDFADWRDTAPKYFREHDSIIGSWNRAYSEASRAREQAAGEDLDDAERQGWQHLADSSQRHVAEVETILRRHRATMRNAGIDPGELTEDLAHVDESEGDDHGQR